MPLTTPLPAPANMRYFDANATTPLHPAARAAWLAAQDACWQNAASPSAGGTRAAALLEQCRARLATRFAPGTQVVFTGGATEGNNAVLAHEAARTGAAAIVSALEHASVHVPARRLFAGRLGGMSVWSDGVPDLFELREELAAAPTALVSLMAVNNETGVIQPVREVAAIAHYAGARLHCDASQAFGKIPPAALRELLAGCDYVVGCAHKFGGPKGVGFIALSASAAPGFTGQLGGGQEEHRRAGTVDVPSIAAMLAALDAAEAELVTVDELAELAGIEAVLAAIDAAKAIVAAVDAPKAAAANDAVATAVAAVDALESTAERAAARDAFEAEVLARIAGAIVNGRSAARVWNTSSLTLPRHAAHRWVTRLERLGFNIAAGAACSSTTAESSAVSAAAASANADATAFPSVSAAANQQQAGMPDLPSSAATPATPPTSRTLAAMGISPEAAARTVRVSALPDATPQDWAALAAAFATAAAALDADAAASNTISIPS